jgi:hypothetical protein
MTANVTFEIARSAQDALRVPASALRLQAPADLLDEPLPQRDAKAPRVPPEGAPGGRPTRPSGRRSRAYIYVQTPTNHLHAIAVKPGISDGILTVVEALDGVALDEGLEVVTAVLRDAEPATTNPFAPPRMGGPRGR